MPDQSNLTRCRIHPKGVPPCAKIDTLNAYNTDASQTPAYNIPEKWIPTLISFPIPGRISPILYLPSSVQLLFERSEFLIPTWVTPQYRATSLKKKLCVCSTNLGFSGGVGKPLLLSHATTVWYQVRTMYQIRMYLVSAGRNLYVRTLCLCFCFPFCFSTAPPHFW